VTGNGGNHPLSREARYVVRTVPRGIASNIGQFVCGDGWGLARAALLAAAVMSTAIAYEVTRIRNFPRYQQLRQAPRSSLVGSGSGTLVSRSGRVRR
jgi:hypothetical protein